MNENTVLTFPASFGGMSEGHWTVNAWVRSFHEDLLLLAARGYPPSLQAMTNLGMGDPELYRQQVLTRSLTDPALRANLEIDGSYFDGQGKRSVRFLRLTSIAGISVEPVACTLNFEVTDLGTDPASYCLYVSNSQDPTNYRLKYHLQPALFSAISDAFSTVSEVVVNVPDEKRFGNAVAFGIGVGVLSNLLTRVILGGSNATN